MIEIIPAMDLIDGKCVRLTQGDFSRETVYSDDPVETARRFEDSGLRRLHMVDLDGARSGSPCNLYVLQHVADATNLIVDYGGGVRTETDAESIFAAGAAMINLGSLAIREPETMDALIEKFGAERLLIGADSRSGKVAIDGWQTSTEVEVSDLISRYAERGLRNFFVTDIAKDGAMDGPATDLYLELIAAFPCIGIIASGGVRSIEDVDELDRIGCAGAIIGRALYEGSIKLEELSRYAR